MIFDPCITVFNLVLIIKRNETNNSLIATQEIGELYEQQQNIDKSSLYFERAAELFDIGGGATSANQCKLKVAQFSAQREQYVTYPNVMCR